MSRRTSGALATPYVEILLIVVLLLREIRFIWAFTSIVTAHDTDELLFCLFRWLLVSAADACYDRGAPHFF